MPTYEFRCKQCNSIFDVHHAFNVPHPTHHTDGCGGPVVLRFPRVRVISEKTRKANEADSTLSRDLAAYKRLRDDGIQPPRIDGAADLERDAKSKYQIETGLDVTDDQWQEGNEITRQLKEAS